MSHRIVAKMSGRLREGKCRVPGHGHNHAKSWSSRYICEVSVSMSLPSKAKERQQGKRQIDQELNMHLARE